MIVGTQVAIEFTSRADRRIRQIETQPGRRLANRTGLARRIRCLTGYIVQQHAIAYAVTMVDSAKVSVSLAACGHRGIWQRIACAR